MNKVKFYHKCFHTSHREAMRNLMAPYKDKNTTNIYTEEALEEALTYLCINDIFHSYSITESKTKNDANLIALNWTEGAQNHYMCWYSRPVRQYNLVTFKDNWSDECDTEGFTIMNDTQLEEWKETMKRARALIESGITFEWYFGTNEWIEYEDFEDLAKCFKVETLTENAVRALKDTVLSRCTYFGLMPTTEAINNWMNDIKQDMEEENDI